MTLYGKSVGYFLMLFFMNPRDFTHKHTTSGVVTGIFFVRFEGNSFCPKMAKLDFLPWNSIFSPENSNFRQFWANSTLQNIIWHKNLHGVTLFIAFLLSKFMGKGENLYLLALTYKILRKKLRNCFSERVKLVFKMLKLVFKTPKLPSPAFH